MGNEGNDLRITYTSDFISCINACAAWNAKSTAVDFGECVGVSWVYGNYGPDGTAGGSECFFKWRMKGNGVQTSTADSARLQVQSPTVMIRPRSH